MTQLTNQQQYQLQAIRHKFSCYPKRLIFTITPGRSGSGFLAKILDLLPDVTAKHEPPPLMSDAFQKVRKNQSAATDYWLWHKLPAIFKEPGHTYIETAHLFCKGFDQALFNLQFGCVDLILLTRSPSQVAQSMYELGTIPGKTTKGSFWYLVPGERLCKTKLPGWGNMHDYQLCFWYAMEVLERQAQILDNSDLTCIKANIDLSRIADRDIFEPFLDRLNLTHTPEFWDAYATVSKQVVNSKAGSKHDRPLTETQRDQLEREVLQKMRVGM